MSLSDSNDDVRTMTSQVLTRRVLRKVAFVSQPSAKLLFAFSLFSREATAGTVRATGGMGSKSRAGKKF